MEVSLITVWGMSETVRGIMNLMNNRTLRIAEASILVRRYGPAGAVDQPVWGLQQCLAPRGEFRATAIATLDM